MLDRLSWALGNKGDFTGKGGQNKLIKGASVLNRLTRVFGTTKGNLISQGYSKTHLSEMLQIDMYFR